MTLRSMEELRQQAQGAQSLNIACIGWAISMRFLCQNRQI